MPLGPDTETETVGDRALAQQSEQAAVTGRILYGVCRGLYESRFSVMVIVLGLADALAQFASVLVHRAYKEHGPSGAASALQVIDQKLDDIRQQAWKIAEAAPQIDKAREN